MPSPSSGRDLTRDGTSPPGVRPARPADARQAALVVYLAVLTCVGAGVYIAWSLGSKGGAGGVVAGAALLLAAGIRLVLPRRLAGLLAVRDRATDVATLAVLGVALFTAGLILPVLRAAIRMRQPAAAVERETRKCQRSR